MDTDNFIKQKALTLSAIELAKNNSQKGFTFLYNQYYNIIYRNILYIVKQKEIAEDLTSETFLKAFKHISKFEKDISFEMWLRTIGNNHSIDWLRKKKRENEIFTDVDEGYEPAHTDNDTPEISMIGKEEAKLLSNAISQMTGKEKRAIELRVYENMSYKEISDELDCSVGSTKSLIHKAKKRLLKKPTKKEKNDKKKSILLIDNRIIG